MTRHYGVLETRSTYVSRVEFSLRIHGTATRRFQRWSFKNGNNKEYIWLLKLWRSKLWRIQSQWHIYANPHVDHPCRPSSGSRAIQARWSRACAPICGSCCCSKAFQGQHQMGLDWRPRDLRHQSLWRNYSNMPNSLKLTRKNCLSLLIRLWRSDD